MTVTGADGSRVAGCYRLITTLTDHRRYPADALIRLYHERWEIESAYLALRHTLLDGRVLRSGDRPGVEQELQALLTLYQLLRMAMVTAVETRPGTNPDRASFTTALEAAREELTAARGICPDGPADLPGVIGRAVLATLLPARRPRYSARKVKCATSRYLSRDDGRPRAATAITAISVTITTPPIDHPGSRPRPHRKLASPPAATTAHPAATRHRAHGHRTPRLERPRTRRTPPDPSPQPAHPARRMGQARLHHPHRLRPLRPQHAARPRILDSRARPLTTRHCAAKRGRTTLTVILRGFMMRAPEGWPRPAPTADVAASFRAVGAWRCTVPQEASRLRGCYAACRQRLPRADYPGAWPSPGPGALDDSEENPHRAMNLAVSPSADPAGTIAEGIHPRPLRVGPESDCGSGRLAWRHATWRRLMFGLCVRFTCKDEASAEAYDRLVAETVEAIKAGEPGTLVYATHLVEGQPLQRIFYELYRDRAAFEAHEASPATRRYLAERDQYLASTKVDWLTLQTGKGTGG